MKVIRLNENDIEKLVKKIIKEEGENFDWIGDIGQYDLFGYYVGKPVEKLTGVSSGNVLEVTAIVGDEIEYFVSYNGMSEIINGYPYSSEGPYYMPVKDLLDELQNGNISKFQLPIDESRLFEEENDDLNWVKDIGEYDLTGTYTRKPIKSDFYIDSEIIDVINIKGQEAEVYIIPISTTLNTEDGEIELPQGDMDNWLHHEVLHYLSGSFDNQIKHNQWGPHHMDVNDLVIDISDGVLIKHEKSISESRLFGGEPNKPIKLTPDERIANYILQKLEKERPDVQHQFIDHTKNVHNVYDIESTKGVLETDLFRVDFSNQSTRITKNNEGFLRGGDFGVVRVYNIFYNKDLGTRTNTIGYAVKMTNDDKPLNIPPSLSKKIYEIVEDQYGDIKVFKNQRRLDKGTDDESDIFDQLTQ